MFHFKYRDFSFKGIPETYASAQKAEISNGRLQFNPFLCHGYLQSLFLPGEIGILFSEYNYERDVILEHLAEDEQHLALWLDLAESDYQYFSFREASVAFKESRIQKNAYLVNTALPFTHLRSKGTKGRSLMIFFPDELSRQFLSTQNVRSILNNYYALKADGLTSVKILPEIEKNINGIFYQWHKHRNVLTIAKYTFQLIEWYCSSLLQTFTSRQYLNDGEAADLFALQKYLNSPEAFLQSNISTIADQYSTPAHRLEELFKVVFHQTIHAYVKEKKMEEAFRRITTTDEPIASIAYELGYSNPSNLSTLMKKHFQLSPQDMRLNIVTKTE